MSVDKSAVFLSIPSSRPFMLSQPGCLSTYSVDIFINRLKISVSAISTKGILPARHRGLWEAHGKLKASSDCIPLPKSLNCSTYVNELSGEEKEEIIVVGVHQRSRASETKSS